MKEFKLREKRQQGDVKFHIESSVINGDFEFHGHDFCELAFIASGQGWHTIGERQYQLKKGDIYIVKGKEKHGFAALENVRIFNIMLNVYDLVEEDCGALPGFWVLFVHEQFDDFLSLYVLFLIDQLCHFFDFGFVFHLHGIDLFLHG